MKTLIPCLLVSMHTALHLYSAAAHSPTNDELAHIAAGLHYWKTGNFSLFRVNPPLTRLIGTYPLVFMSIDSQQTEDSSFTSARPKWSRGQSFARANFSQLRVLMLIARLSSVAFSLVGAWVCYTWSKELFDINCANMSLALWCFCPFILGYGYLVTADIGGTALFGLASFHFWKWLVNSSFRTAIIASLSVAAAELSKFTCLVLLAGLPIAFLASCVWRPAVRISIVHRLVQFTVLIGATILWINALYGFQGSFHRLGDFTFVSNLLAGTVKGDEALDRGNVFSSTILCRCPIPLPEHFILGIDQQQYDIEAARPSYMNGEWRSPGWRQFYIYALAVKLPIGAILLACAGLLFALSGFAAPAHWTALLCIGVPAVLVVIVLSADASYTLHARYAMPTVVSVCILPAWAWRMQPRWVAMGMRILLMEAIVSSLFVYPHSLSYVNEAVGGPLSGPTCLLDSSIDWGQDVYYFRSWMACHPNDVVSAAIVGPVDMRTMAPEVLSIPADARRESGITGQHPAVFDPKVGWYALSVQHVYGYNPDYTMFKMLKPTAHAGYSIYIYYVSSQDSVLLESILAEARRRWRSQSERQ